MNSSICCAIASSMRDKDLRTILIKQQMDFIQKHIVPIVRASNLLTSFIISLDNDILYYLLQDNTYAASFDFHEFSFSVNITQTKILFTISSFDGQCLIESSEDIE